MKRTLIFRSIIWILLCAICTLAFALSHAPQLGWLDIAKSIFFGLRLDFAFLGYILLFTLLTSLHPLTHQLGNWVFGFIVLMQIMLTGIDISLYKQWQHTINYQFIEYSKHPLKAMGNMSHQQLILAIVMLFLSVFVIWKWMVRRHPKYKSVQWKKWTTYPLALLLLGVSFIALRGGIQVAPANTSFAFWGKNAALNYASLNNSWNLMFHLLNGQADQPLENFQVVSSQEAIKQYSTFFQDNTEVPVIANSPKPNIVIVLIESWTANLMGACQAAEDFTPNFNKIVKEGIFFSHAYASGNRTDKGLAAVVSGFPAQATASIMTIPSKAQKLPSIIRSFKEAGYHSTFYYGGEPEFANKKAYLLNAGIDEMKIKFNYPLSDPRGKWGIHDEAMFNHLAEDIQNDKGPFIKLFLSHSSHEPFDYPNSQAKQYSGAINFRNSIAYVDSCLGVFWDQVRNVPNTLFIITADHGRIIEKGHSDKVPKVNQIPLFIGGTALNHAWKGREYHHVINQHHFPRNLLKMSGIEAGNEKFQFQGNWFNPEQLAYITFYNGICLTNGKDWAEYHNQQKTSYLNGNDSLSQSWLLPVQIYQQRVMEAFYQY